MPELKATTTLDSTGIETGLNKIKKKTDETGLSFKTLGSNILGALSARAAFSFAKSVVDMGSNIADMSDQMGVTTDQFQALQVAAMNAGVPMEQIQGALNKVTIAMGQAEEGISTYVDLFKTLGMTQDEVVKLSPMDMFERVSKTLTTASRGTKEYSAALELLGTRSGAKLVEVLRQVAGGMDEMTEAALRSGKIIENDTVKSLDQMGDMYEEFFRMLKVGWAKAVEGGSLLGTVIYRLTHGQSGNPATIAQEKFDKKMQDSIDKNKAAKSDQLLRDQRAIEVKKELEKKALEEKIKAEKKALEETQKKEKETAEEKKKALEERLKKLYEEADIVIAEQARRDELFKKAKDLKDIEVSTPDVVADRLAKIGGTLGGQASPIMRDSQKQIALDEARNKFLENLPRATANELRAMGVLE